MGVKGMRTTPQRNSNRRVLSITGVAGNRIKRQWVKNSHNVYSKKCVKL